MFSYISTSKNTHENNLIQEIQCIANEIFDNHTTSISRTDQQEMSLELSPATSEDNLENKRRVIDENQEDVQGHIFRMQIDNPITHKNQNQNNTQDNVKKATKPNKNDENRMTRSAIMGNNQRRQQGSFSNKYGAHNNSKTLEGDSKYNGQRSKMNHHEEQEHDQEGYNIDAEASQISVLHQSSMNKSNILMGILNEASKKPQKSPAKGKFSSIYGTNYLSPYSTKGIRQNPKSYMQKSVSFLKKPKPQTLQLQYIKKRINQNIQPHISYRKEKSQLNKRKNPKLSQVKSKYKEYKPVLNEYNKYAEEHIYKKMKNEMGCWEEKKKKYEMRSPEEIQMSWQGFIEKEERFIEDRKQAILAKQLQKINQQTTHCLASPSPSKNNLFIPGLQTQTHLTPEDFVKKYQRQKQKLKQKLESFEVSNFLQKSFQHSKKYGQEIFESVWGSNLQVSNQQYLQGGGFSLFSEGYSTFKEKQDAHDKEKEEAVDKENKDGDNKKIEAEDQNNDNFSVIKEKDPYVDFFTSARKDKIQQQQQHKLFKRKGKGIKVLKYDSSMMAKSSIIESNRISKHKSTSREHNNSTSRFSKSKPKNKQGMYSSSQNANLSLFIKQSPNPYFSSDHESFQFSLKKFNPSKHNSAIFNELLTSEHHLRHHPHKSTSRSKSANSKYKSPLKNITEPSSLIKQKNIISELLNPKYFKSINEMEEYASNSREKLDQPRKTYVGREAAHKNKSNGNQNQNISQILPNKQGQWFGQVSRQNNQYHHHLQGRKNVISSFDQNLMKKTIEDLEKMRVDIEENKKKRKYRIDNYRNFSNLRAGQKPQQKLNSHQPRQNYHHRHMFTRNDSPLRERSVSPIYQEDSISSSHHNLSVSVIHPVNQNSHFYQEAFNNKHLHQVSQFSSSRNRQSNVIKVISGEEIEFILGDSVKE